MNRIILAIWIALLDRLVAHKSLFENNKWLAPHYDELVKVRLALVTALLIVPGKDPLLDSLREKALSYDVDHDASHRALRALFTAMELHFVGEQKIAVEKAHATLYPEGLTFTLQSHRAQVGHAELFAERVASAEVKAGLDVMAIELKSPQTWIDRCLEANKQMALAVAAVDQRVAELTGNKNQSEIPSVAEARNAVFKRFSRFLKAVDDAYPEGTKERELLIGPYLSELEKAKPSPTADEPQPQTATQTPGF